MTRFSARRGAAPTVVSCYQTGVLLIIWVPVSVPSAQTALATCLWLLAPMRCVQNCCPEEVFSFFTNMKRGLCVKSPSEQHFLQYSEHHWLPRHIQSQLKWTFPFWGKVSTVSPMPTLTRCHGSKSTLPYQCWTRNKQWLAEKKIVEYDAVISSYILYIQCWPQHTAWQCYVYC